MLLLYDLASLKKMKNRHLIAAIGYATHAGAILTAALGGQVLHFSKGVVVTGWFLVGLGFWWLCYCLFFFPPITRNYVEAGELVLTTEGPYALTRHPGFLGYLVFITGLVLVFGSFLLLVCAPVWAFFDLLHIIVQDRWIFRQLFSGYEKYSRDVPMLFPNAKSFRRFLETAPFKH